MHFQDHLGDQLSFWAAFLVGAAHAIEPSHGKAVLLAYLVGIRGRLRDLVALALLITLTHSLVVLALAAVAGGVHEHFASQAFLPILELAAAALVVGLGAWMSLRNLRGDYYCCLGHSHDSSEPQAASVDLPVAVHDSAPRSAQTSEYRSRGRDSPREVGTIRGMSGLTTHHSPLATLLYLGITGGLVPCQSGLAVVLIAASRGTLLRALVLTATFSMGMGLSLFAVGVAILVARERASSWLARPGVGSWVSWATAGLILALGGLAAARALGEIL